MEKIPKITKTQKFKIVRGLAESILENKIDDVSIYTDQEKDVIQINITEHADNIHYKTIMALTKAFNTMNININCEHYSGSFWSEQTYDDGYSQIQLFITDIDMNILLAKARLLGKLK